MKRSPAVIAIALLFSAAPPVRGHDSLPRTPVAESLSGIDFLPDRTTLSNLLSGNVSALIALANDDMDESLSPGVRIRAYRTLGLFDDDVARAGVSAAINRYRNSDLAIEQLYLIAALEALGDIGDGDQVDAISPSLGHDHRDVRAAAARALGATRAQTACGLLQTQRGREIPQTQVVVAIDEALRGLGPPCSIDG